MKVKLLFLLIIIASLFSFVLPTKVTKIENKMNKSTIDHITGEKELMQPFVMADRNQFD